MLSFIWHSGWALLGAAGVIVVICGLVAWFVPPFRKLALMIGGAALSAAAIYAKGNRDRAAYEQKLKDEAVEKARTDYAKIDTRPDDAKSVDERLRNGSF